MITINNLTYEYEANKPVLDNVCLHVKKGEWVSILGHNGSGKSTLAKLIIGLLRPKSGEIIVDGIPLSYDSVYDIRKKVGIVFQNPDNQFVGVTVRDDIAFGLENLRVPRSEMIERIETFAGKVNMLDFLNKEPHNLSGGQKQRVAIAGILAMHTDVLIFDEATSMLDPDGRKMVLESIQALHKEGATVITITHDMREAVKSDRVVVLKNGQVLKEGPSKTVLNDHETLEKSNLELLLPLHVIKRLREKNLSNERLESVLWALSLNA